jgi:hypothetical protein
MARPSGAHTHPPSPWVWAVVTGAVLAVISQAPGARHAAASAGSALIRLLDVILIAVASLAGLALAGALVLAVLAARRRSARQVERGWTATVGPAAPRSRPAMTALPPPSTRRLDPPPSGPAVLSMPPPAAPREVHYHVHVHGDADPEAIAKALHEHRG